MPVSAFHPVVERWFRARFGEPTEPQARGWPEILVGRHTLIAAPTGSGKTLAAFLCAIDRLVRRAADGGLRDETEVVYVSPLKALANDIQKNLLEPLAGIQQAALESGWLLPEIRVLVRTGDTMAWDREAMLRRPPHILITTPESLFILLTAERSRRLLRTARVVIIDEIHAPARDKRGSHLTLSLERLEHLVHSFQRSALSSQPDLRQARGQDPAPATSGPAEGGPGALQRIGLSATVRPIDAIARMLGGAAREVTVVELGHRRALDIGVEVPRDELSAVATNEMWGEIYDRVAELVQAHRTTLVFVNTRRVAERMAHHLTERLGGEAVAAHHGSLSRKLRLSAEERLKRGDLKVVVATSSLELGIDIGTVDLVCQIGSPRSIALALQRIGRAGHWRGAVPKGRLFASTRDELIECAALVRSIRSGELDRILVPRAPLDVLAQQIVAAAASEEWREDDLFAMVRGAAPYADLSREDFDAVLEILSEGIATKRSRGTAYVHRDRVNGRLRGRRGARLAAITSGGAIPDNANYAVVLEPEGVTVGTVDEDFAVESMAGDVFLLGNSSWRIRRIEAGRLRVEDAHGAPPTIPFWRGEAPARTAELSAAVSQLREDIVDRLDRATAAAAADWLIAECGLDRRGAEQAVVYIAAARAALGVIPTQRTIVAERFFDEGGGMQLVLHVPFGGRLNRAWGLSLRKRFCRSFNFELQAAATDDGIVISLGEQHSFPLDAVFAFLSPRTVRDVLVQALLDAPMFAARWRWNATRMLALLRFAGGRKVPPPIQRMRADDLLAAVFPDQAACQENIVGDIRIPDHPLVKETIRDCLTEAMDVDGLESLLSRIEAREVSCIAIDTHEPSPLSHEVLNANPFAYLDDAPLEERRARAVQTRRVLSPDVAEGLGALDPEAIAEVRSEAWPVVRDRDELHDALLTLGIFPDAGLKPCVTDVPDADPGLQPCATNVGANLEGLLRVAAADAGAGEGIAGGAGLQACGRWRPFFEELVREGRAYRGSNGAPTSSRFGRTCWVAAERVALVRAALPHLTLDPPPGTLPPSRHEGLSREAALVGIVRGWMDSIGPVTVVALAAQLGLVPAAVDAAMLELEAEGQVLRGHFTAAGSKGQQKADGGSGFRQTGDEPPLEWCNRRLLARIHRLTLGRLRREIEPVTTAEFMRFLLRWQHVGRGAQLHGVSGLLQVVGQLQGFEIPAAAWERHILPLRLARYESDLLDRACLAGEVAWGRVSPHPALDPAPGARLQARGIDVVESGFSRIFGTPLAGLRPRAIRGGAGALHEPDNPSRFEGAGGRSRRVRPTRVAPIALVLREDLPWLLSLAQREVRLMPEIAPSLSAPARDLLTYLEARGASFFNELVRGTRRLPAEVEDGLWELTAAGLVTADGFDNLRSLLDVKRRRGEGRHRGARPRHTAGRWALLQALQTGLPPQAESASGREASVDPGSGRSLEDVGGVSGFSRTFADPLEGCAHQLLRRWGVVFRDLLARETLAPPWRDLLVVFRRLEAQGLIRGGRFVAGFLGEQFAMPEAVDALRAVRRSAAQGEIVRLSAADPLNLAGIILPGPRVPAVLGETLTYRDGVPVDAETRSVANAALAPAQA